MKNSFLVKKIFLCLLLAGVMESVAADVLGDLNTQIASKIKERDDYQASLSQLQKMLDEKSKDASSVGQLSQIQLSIQGLSEQISVANKLIQELNDKLSVVKAQPVAAAN
jgi:uncharacterized coiled-coil protein SlyX